MSNPVVRDEALKIFNEAIRSFLDKKSKSERVRKGLRNREAIAFLDILSCQQKLCLPVLDSRYDIRDKNFVDKERKYFTPEYFADHTVYIWKADLKKSEFS